MGHLVMRVGVGTGRFGTVAVAAYVFLWVPDLDLLLLPILHHRSIVTHSVLPCVVLLLLGPRYLGRETTAGALLGVSVHLSADMLTGGFLDGGPIGFGQKWVSLSHTAPLGVAFRGSRVVWVDDGVIWSRTDGHRVLGEAVE